VSEKYFCKDNSRYKFIAQGQTMTQHCLFGSADKVKGICLEENTQALA
jgi:hypothetical protein